MGQAVRRRQDGTFAPGQSGNESGRPRFPYRSAWQERNLAVIQETITDNDLREIFLRCCEDAKKGNSVARAFLARFCLPTDAQLEVLLEQNQETVIKVVFVREPISGNDNLGGNDEPDERE